MKWIDFALIFELICELRCESLFAFASAFPSKSEYLFLISLRSNDYYSATAFCRLFFEILPTSKKYRILLSIVSLPEVADTGHRRGDYSTTECRTQDNEGRSRQSRLSAFNADAMDKVKRRTGKNDIPCRNSIHNYPAVTIIQNFLKSFPESKCLNKKKRHNVSRLKGYDCSINRRSSCVSP